MNLEAPSNNDKKLKSWRYQSEPRKVNFFYQMDGHALSEVANGLNDVYARIQIVDIAWKKMNKGLLIKNDIQDKYVHAIISSSNV